MEVQTQTARGEGQEAAGCAPEAEKPRADRVVRVRLTEAELAEFDAQIEVLGLNRNRALRIAARRVGGFIECPGEVLAELRAIGREISAISRSVNAIARAAGQTGEPDYRAFMEERRKLGLELVRFDTAAQIILDTAERRGDGLARLEKAAKS